MTDNLYTGSKRRQFQQGYQEALRDVVSAAITNAGVYSPVEAMLRWIADNADNPTTLERAARVATWAEAGR